MFARPRAGRAVCPAPRRRDAVAAVLRRVVAGAAVAEIAAAAAVAGLPAGLHAQVSAATGLGALLRQQTNDPWHSTTRIDPAARIDGRWFQLRSGAALLGGDAGGIRVDDASASFLAAPPPFGDGHVRLTTSASVERQRISPIVQHTSGTIESALSMRAGGWGAWLGLAAEHTREIDSAKVQPLMRFGLWRQLGSATISLSRESHGLFYTTRPDSAARAVGDSFPKSHALLMSNVVARVSWSLDNVYFDTRFGMQPKVAANPQTLWGHASATVGLSSRLSLVAEAGNQPAIQWTGAPARRFASLGLRVAPSALMHPAPPANVRPSAASFNLEAIGKTAYMVTMRVPGARTVEISGDFDGWKPLALREARPDVWVATMDLAPGTYHVNVRVNGDAWTAPPGLPATTDDFNGTVGLVVVR